MGGTIVYQSSKSESTLAQDMLNKHLGLSQLTTKISRNKELLLVNIWYGGLWYLFNYHLK